jgi:hypothetical protein
MSASSAQRACLQVTAATAACWATEKAFIDQHRELVSLVANNRPETLQTDGSLRVLQPLVPIRVATVGAC